MIMILDNVPIFLIMLAGKWYYYAFIKNIRKKVVEFSKVISYIMIKNYLFHILPYMISSLFDPIT